MGVDVEIEVRCLPPDIAWDLFRKKVGERALRSHSDIPKLAKIIAQKCRGLPLALNIIGETMASKRTIEEWCHAIDVLTLSAANFPGMEDEILSILKFSYDHLKEEKVKSCFLYCSLFPEDYNIEKRKLVDFWAGKGIIEGNRERDRVENEGFEIIGTLIRACLLEDDRNYVKMHDVVREMALWIASHFQKNKENFIVQTGVGLHQIPEVENCKVVSRMSLMQNYIQNIYGSPEYPKLLTLFLNDNVLKNISSEFFCSMLNLVVLDLSENMGLEELPEKISMLVSLRYLDLSVTRIRQLPNGLKELEKLVYLYLSGTHELQSIDGVSSLRNLQTLGLIDSGACHSPTLLEELLLLEHLNCLTIHVSGASRLEQFLRINKLTRCIEELQVYSVMLTSDGISFEGDLCRLRNLNIRYCDISNVKVDWKRKRSRLPPPLHNHRSPCNSSYFQNLHIVSISRCFSLKDLTWLLLAPNLADMALDDLPVLKEIMSKEKVGSDTNEQPFGNLRSLVLTRLPEIESIYWNSLPFIALKEITIIECPKLRKLPLNSKSAEGQENLIYASTEWMRQLEWEDEDTKKRFFPER